jgi:hypothetical protein
MYFYVTHTSKIFEHLLGLAREEKITYFNKMYIIFTYCAFSYCGLWSFIGYFSFSKRPIQYLLLVVVFLQGFSLHWAEFCINKCLYYIRLFENNLLFLGLASAIKLISLPVKKYSFIMVYV